MLTFAEVREILARVQFDDWSFNVLPTNDALYLQVAFEDRGGVLQKGRKWYISPHSTEGEIVQTALKAVLTALEHEAREKFLYRGKPIFGPHLSIEALHAISDIRSVRAAREVASGA